LLNQSLPLRSPLFTASYSREQEYLLCWSRLSLLYLFTRFQPLTPGLNHSFSVLGSQLSGAFSTHGKPGQAQQSTASRDRSAKEGIGSSLLLFGLGGLARQRPAFSKAFVYSVIRPKMGVLAGIVSQISPASSPCPSVSARVRLTLTSNCGRSSRK